ncbi:hypothetical protein ANANG_G00088360 [Anguilla anguilla]|uniref:SEA domain-containing protein n=1 Tax=Anguilla anguilla TaxID=7936 RepID=A0A9D3MLD3_ANGAN|nr:hypothetical protein ANANG_G00088360 [Anguilla anguilla]
MHFACCPIKILYCFVSFSFISRREEGTAVEVALIFNGTSSETLPSTDNVAETLIRAVTDPDSTLTTRFNVTLIVDSIRVLTPTSTTPEVPATGSPLPAATTVVAATTTVPTQVLILQATLEVPFVPALENSQSTEYQVLATTVIGFYDVIFSSRYGLLFERTEVRSFSRREEGTAVEVALIFNGTSSETLPSTDDVAETLIRAVTDPDSTLTTRFNVTLIVDSIRVLTPTSTTPEVPTTGSPLPAATTIAPVIATPTAFTSIATSGVSNSAGSATTIPDSISVINPTTSTTSEAPATGSTVPAATTNATLTTSTTPFTTTKTVLVLDVTLIFPFEPALEDNQSPQFKALAAKVVAVCDAIYRARYGLLFIRTVVRSFRSISIRMLGTDVEAELIFNTTMPDALPNTEDVKKTLESAVTNPNSTITSEFNITLVPDSIRVTSVANASTTPTTKLTTSVANASTTTKVKLTTAKATTRATTTPSSAKPATAAPTSASTATPSATVQIEFTSRETFVPDLLNQSSKAFQARSKLTKEQIEPIFRRAFSSFIQLNIRSFREGSIVTNADMTFKSSESLPSNDQILSTLRNAILNSQISFDIDPDSIKLTSAISSGVSDMTSVLTASSLAMVSLLLSHCW